MMLNFVLIVPLPFLYIMILTKNNLNIIVHDFGVLFCVHDFNVKPGTIKSDSLIKFYDYKNSMFPVAFRDFKTVLFENAIAFSCTRVFDTLNVIETYKNFVDIDFEIEMTNQYFCKVLISDLPSVEIKDYSCTLVLPFSTPGYISHSNIETLNISVDYQGHDIYWLVPLVGTNIFDNQLFFSIPHGLDPKYLSSIKGDKYWYYFVNNSDIFDISFPCFDDSSDKICDYNSITLDSSMFLDLVQREDKFFILGFSTILPRFQTTKIESSTSKDIRLYIDLLNYVDISWSACTFTSFKIKDVYFFRIDFNLKNNIKIKLHKSLDFVSKFDKFSINFLMI